MFGDFVVMGETGATRSFGYASPVLRAVFSTFAKTQANEKLSYSVPAAGTNRLVQDAASCEGANKMQPVFVVMQTPLS